MLSRVAESLYWMGRYLERAEHSARMLDENLQGMLDKNPDPAAERWERLLKCLQMQHPESAEDIYAVTRLLAFDPQAHSSILHCISGARENARQVRQQISSEMWEQLNLLYLSVRSARIQPTWDAQPEEFFHSVKQGIHLFQGITDSTLSHGEGWQFIQLGKFLERAITMATLLDAHFGTYFDGTEHVVEAHDFLEWVVLLKSATAFEAYCKVYTAEVKPDRIAEFLLLDPEFPRSVSFCARNIKCSLDAIAETTELGKATKACRLAGRLRASLDFSYIDEILAGGMRRTLMDIDHQCVQIHQAVQQVYITYPIEVALAT